MSSSIFAALVGVTSVVGLSCGAAAQAQEAVLTRADALALALMDDSSIAAADAASRGRMIHRRATFSLAEQVMTHDQSPEKRS